MGIVGLKLGIGVCWESVVGLKLGRGGGASWESVLPDYNKAESA